MKIGEQIWMAENLKVTRYADGSSATYYWYDDDIGNKDIYGALYDWDAVMNGHSASSDEPSGVQGICPAGWHVPSDSEWYTLNISIGESDNDGGKLKEAGTAHWKSPNTGAANEFGFTALPGGYRDGIGEVYSSITENARFYSSSHFFWVGGERFLPKSTGLIYNTAGFHSFPHEYFYEPYHALSVRCVKDQP